MTAALIVALLVGTVVCILAILIGLTVAEISDRRHRKIMRATDNLDHEHIQGSPL